MMAEKITGIDVVLKRMNAKVRKMAASSRAGARVAALIVLRRSQQLVPVDTNKLRASVFTNVRSDSTGAMAVVGYQAAYAPFVHEIMENKHPVGQAKFLETALKEKEGEALQAWADAAKID